MRESGSGSDSCKFGVGLGLDLTGCPQGLGFLQVSDGSGPQVRSLSFSPGWIFGRLKMTSFADCYPAMVEPPSRIVASPLFHPRCRTLLALGFTP